MVEQQAEDDVHRAGYVAYEGVRASGRLRNPPSSRPAAARCLPVIPIRVPFSQRRDPGTCSLLTPSPPP